MAGNIVFLGKGGPRTKRVTEVVFLGRGGPSTSTETAVKAGVNYFTATGLTPGTYYWHHTYQEDGTDFSNIVSSAAFSTTAASVTADITNTVNAIGQTADADYVPLPVTADATNTVNAIGQTADAEFSADRIADITNTVNAIGQVSDVVMDVFIDGDIVNTVNAIGQTASAIVPVAGDIISSISAIGQSGEVSSLGFVFAPPNRVITALRIPMSATAFDYQKVVVAPPLTDATIRVNRRVTEISALSYYHGASEA